MIHVQNLVKRFGAAVAVDNVSFDVGRGDVLGVLGPNGAGKTTTMKMIAGFLAPDEGFVEIDDINVQEQPKAVKLRVGYLAEGIPLYGEMPVHSFLEFVGKTYGLCGDDLNQRLAAVVRSVHLKDVITKRISTLSKGFQRRVGLAQAMLADPDYLVLDEPTDGLDPNQKTQVRELIRRISKDKGIILSTHILEEVEPVCNRVIIMHKGKIIVDTTPRGLQELSDYHNSISLEIEGLSGSRLQEKLQAVSGLFKITPMVSREGCCLVPVDHDQAVDRINELAKGSGWKIRRLETNTGNLEDVFRQLTKN